MMISAAEHTPGHRGRTRESAKSHECSQGRTQASRPGQPPSPPNSCRSQDDLDAFPLLASLNLTEPDLESLSRQGFVSAEIRPSGTYFKLRFRRDGCQVVRGLGKSSKRAAQAQRELKQLQKRTEAWRKLNRLMLRAKKLLRESRQQLRPILEVLGYHFHGTEIRQHQASMPGVDAAEFNLKCAGASIVTGEFIDTEGIENDDGQYEQRSGNSATRRTNATDQPKNGRRQPVGREEKGSNPETPGGIARFTRHASSVPRSGCKRSSRNVSRAETGDRRQSGSRCRTFGPAANPHAGSPGLSENRSDDRTSCTPGRSTGRSCKPTHRLSDASGFSYAAGYFNRPSRRNSILIPVQADTDMVGRRGPPDASVAARTPNS